MLLRFLLVSAVASLGVDLPTWRQAASDVRTSVAWCGQRVAALAQQAAASDATPEVRVADRSDAAVDSPMPMGTDAFADERVEAPPMPTGLAAFASEPIGAEPMPTDLTAFADEPQPTPEPIPAPEPAPAPAVVAVDPDAGFQVVMSETVNHFTTDLAGGDLVPADTALAMIAEPPPAPEASAVDLYPGLAFDLNHEADGLPEAWQTVPSPALAAMTPVPETPVESPEPPKAERLASAIRLTGQAVHAWMSLLQAPSVALDEAVSLSR